MHHGGVVRLHVSQFRSYPVFSLKMDPRPVALTGPNGIGKTNLLEALSLLGPGRGLRQAPLADMIAQGQNPPLPWSVFAEVHTKTEAPTFTVASRLDPQALQSGQERRQLYLEGSPLSPQSEILDHLWILSLTPQMDGLLREGAQGRRRFLDHIVSGLDPIHPQRMAQYAHHMKERNALLKGRNPDADWLDTLEIKMAQSGVSIAAQRLDTVQKLQSVLDQTTHAFPKPLLECDGIVERLLTHHPSLWVEAHMQELLRLNRPQDQLLGHCPIGPHRTDIVVKHKGYNRMAALCSTGEQKALLVSWLLAAAELYQKQRAGVPLLLLDEVMAHLDSQRRIDLFDEIDRLKVQSWMTGTDLSFFIPFGRKLQCFDLMTLRSTF